MKTILCEQKTLEFQMKKKKAEKIEFTKYLQLLWCHIQYF